MENKGNKIIVNTENAPAAVGPYSQAIICGDFVYTSGVIAINPESGTIIEKDIEGQTKQIMESLSETLKSAGASLDDIVKTTCYLANMADFTEFNRIYGEYIKYKPARSCAAVTSLPKGSLAEVEAIAYIKR